jgi:hypothetical protein
LRNPSSKFIYALPPSVIITGITISLCIHYTKIKEKSKAPVRSETHAKIHRCDGALSTKNTVQPGMALPWFQLTVYVFYLATALRGLII